MKKSFISLFVASLLMLFGCEKEQSELSMDMLTERATIEGYIVYNAGVDTTASDNYLIERMVPVKNQKVFVEIAYSAIKDNSEGKHIVETTTDSVGRYSIEVPTTNKGIPAKVRMQEFTAFMSICEGVKDGKPRFKTDLYSYSYTRGIASLEPSAIEFMEDTVCTSTKLGLDSLNLKERITLEGRIELAHETAFRQGDYKAAANNRVEFRATYLETDTAEYIFNTTIDAAGNYEITLPLASYEEGFKTLEVAVMGTGANYVHYTAPGKQNNLSGAYVKDAIFGEDGHALTDIIEGMKYTMPTMYLKFVPNYNNGITEGNRPSSWSDNLVGWEKYDGFTETQTITGKYLLATETSFGVGAYSNETGEAKISIGYLGTDARESKTVDIPVAADGTYSFKVPVKDANEIEDGGIVLRIGYPNAKTLTHYNSSGETVKLQGDYNDITVIKDPMTEATEMGDVYCNFMPSTDQNILDELMWNANLAAWKKPQALKDGKEVAVTLTANIHMAVETAFATGSYVAAEGMLAVVTVGSSDSCTFPVLEGKINGEVYLDNATSEPEISVTIVNTVDDFKHFDLKGKERIIAGTYYSSNYDEAYWTGMDADNREAWANLGDVYCKFTPDVNSPAPEAWDTYFQYIAGWQRRADADVVENVNGTMYKAVETNYYTGMYVPIDNMLTKVDMGGVSYVGLTNAQGQYSIPVYVKDTETNPSVSVYPYFTNVEVDYYAYTAVGKKETKKVSYSHEFKVGRIDGYTKWSERGSVYYMVNEHESKRLLGWANEKNRLLYGHKEVITIKGSILKAGIKTDGRDGVWNNDNTSRGATVTIDGTSYKTLVTGNYVIRYNVKTVPNDITFAIAVNGGSSDKKEVFTYRYVDPTSTTLKSEMIYGYYLSGGLNSTSVNKEASRNDFYVTPKDARPEDITGKVTLRFGVTDPTDAANSLPNWSIFSPTYLVQ